MGYVADRRLWLTQEKGAVVEEGDPRAAFLFATPGFVISDEDCHRYGLRLEDGALVVGSVLSQPEHEPEPEEQLAKESDVGPARRGRKKS